MISVAVIGGGLFGCSVALKAAEFTDRVCLIEKQDDILQGASGRNQARVHHGYHYPRSFLTAWRSRINFELFVRRFPEAVETGLSSYYAIARKMSKITSRQFVVFCRRIGAPLDPAEDSVKALFNPRLIEEVFKVREYVFDAGCLRQLLRRRLAARGVELLTEARVRRVLPANGGLHLEMTAENGAPRELSAQLVFNCTYSRLNELISNSGLEPIPLLHEWAELALIRPPEALLNKGITVIDGPFFSVMPYPMDENFTFSHVRYTPHCRWFEQDRYSEPPPAGASRYQHMLQDARRYLPCLGGTRYLGSMWETKTLLPRSEFDDCRPILLKRDGRLSRFVHILGGKIDNVFDIEKKVEELLQESA